MRNNSLVLLGTGLVILLGSGTAAAQKAPNKVDGSGLPGVIPVWTGNTKPTTTLGMSSITDTGTRVTVGLPVVVMPTNADGLQASSSGSQSVGVNGFNANNIGVSGQGGLNGVLGNADGSNAGGAIGCCITGVVGLASSPDSRIAIGVGGYVDAPNGWGTQGLNLGGGLGVLAESRGGTSQGTALRAESDGGEAAQFLVDSANGILLHGFLVNSSAGTWDEKFLVDATGNLTTHGNAFKPGGGSWATLSDVRTKKSVEPIANALGQLLKLHGVTYEYTNPSAFHELPGTHIGVVAQDVEQAFPSWVDTGNDGYKRVTFRGFEGVAVEAVRELDTNTKEAMARIAELERQNAELRQSLEALADVVRSLQAK